MPVCYTHSVSAIGRHVVIVGRISKLDSVLTGFGLTAQGTFSTGETQKQEFTFLSTGIKKKKKATKQNKLHRSKTNMAQGSEGGEREDGMKVCIIGMALTSWAAGLEGVNTAS